MNYARFSTLAVRIDGAVHHLTLNRPEQLNAIDMTMAGELLEYFGALQFDTDVRVVVLRGAGRHFCAGLDLHLLDGFKPGPEASLRLQRLFADFIRRMRRCPQPIIALVQGAAAGGGLALALASDVRYAAEDARFNVAMAKVGLSGCDMGISYFLPRSVGASNAAEMMMGGKFVNAQKALRIGLVSEIAPKEQLEALAEATLKDMLHMSPVGLRLTKEGLNASQEAASLEAVLALEDRGQVICIGPYFQEGAAAFREKRAPDYSRD